MLVDWVAGKAQNPGHKTLAADTIEETGNVSFFEHLGFVITEKTVSGQFDSATFRISHAVKMEKSIGVSIRCLDSGDQRHGPLERRDERPARCL